MNVKQFDQLDAFLEAMAPVHDDIQHEMATRAADEGFPIIGPAAGAVLRQFAVATGAERIFEFGSGFGYSATWFAPALPDDGELILTEIDANEMADAETYLEQAGYDHLITYEVGDATEIINRHDGPFDVVLIDAAKEQYVECYESVRDKVATGGVIIADNALTAGDMDTAGIMDAVIEGDTDPALDATAEGIRRYLQHIIDDAGFVTSVLPVGSGLAVSVKHNG